jgi:hypothetical protein
VKEASVTFTATDVGVEAMQFAVTTTDIVPAVTAPNGIKGWADYSGGSKTVDLAGFTAPDNNIKTVYVHVKDALGNIRSSGAVTVNNSGTALYIDSAAPTFTDSGTPGAVTDPVSPQQKGSTSDYYVKGASVTFTAADTGVAGMQFAVTIISTPPDAADTAPNGIKGWAAYSGDSKTVDLSGFTAPDNNIKTVYVHVKDALGHTVSSGEVPVYVGGDLYIDSTAPVAVPSAVLTTVVDNTSYYTVSNAKIKFTPSDGGVGGIEYAVLSSVGTPSSWTSYDPVDGEVEEDLSVFTENIQNVYLYLKDALGNEATTPKTVYTAGPLYIDITPPVVSGSISIDPVTGELTGITIGDGTGNVAGFDETLLSGNYNLISSATGAGTPTLTFSGDYSITGGTPSPLPVTGTEDYTITLTVKDKGGVEQDYTIGITFTAADGTYTFTTDGAWVASGEPIIPSATMVPFGFASPGFLPGNVPAAASGGRAPAPVYGSIGGVRYPLAGLTTAARVPARPSSAGQSAAGVSYSYRSEDAEYLHSYGVSARNPGSSGGPVSVTVVSEPASLRRERPNRAQTAPRNAPQDDDSAYTEDLAAEDSEFEDYGLSLSALPADSPVPVDSPPDNRVPFRNSNVDPFILPPQADGSGSRAKGLRGTDDDEEE